MFAEGGEVFLNQQFLPMPDCTLNHSRSDNRGLGFIVRTDGTLTSTQIHFTLADHNLFC